MAEIVVMPKIGLTAREAVLREWLVDEGDTVAEGDPLFEIETDKIVSEVEAPAGGVLLRRIEADVTVQVGEPIAVIGEAGEDVSGVALFEPASTIETEAVAPAVIDEPSVGLPEDAGDIRLKASPIARKRAKELGVDLSTVRGSGPGGRITQKDIEDALHGATAHPVAPASTGDVEQPTKLRRAIAEAMSLSATVPQFSLQRDLDVTMLRAVLAARSLGRRRSISVADAIGAATARAIAEGRVFLRSWDDGVFRYADGVHLGLAVAVDDGLIVPVLRHAETLSVERFSDARRDLQDRTHAGKLTAEESAGAVFTISNLGPLGIDRFRALVNPPESGILALGRAREVDQRTFVTVDLSADHRVVDGAQGARLLGEIARLVESDFAELFAERSD